jgi:hypothetical protein
MTIGGTSPIARSSTMAPAELGAMFITDAFFPREL